MKSDVFWDYFNRELRPFLGARAHTFTHVFEYLDQFDHPLTIIETGCMRDPGNLSGDGCSTRLFDKYAEWHPGTSIRSVDIDPDATATCKSHVSQRVHVHTGDSVAYLQSLADGREGPVPAVDLLYLDSYDVNFEDAFPSAFHHMKELVAAGPMIHRDTLVMVDDSPANLNAFFQENGMIQLLTPPRVGGKGKLVAEYAAQVGATSRFQSYQCAWIGMRLVERPR
jgi:hypothetical protein